MADAEKLASKQKQISISEFFEKNKHFLGFDTLQRAVITANTTACSIASLRPQRVTALAQPAATAQ